MPLKYVKIRKIITLNKKIVISIKHLFQKHNITLSLKIFLFNKCHNSQLSRQIYRVKLCKTILKTYLIEKCAFVPHKQNLRNIKLSDIKT